MEIETISSDASASVAPESNLLEDSPVDALALTMRFLSYAEAMRAGSSCPTLHEAYYKNSLIHVTTDVVGCKSVAIDLDVGSAKQVVLLSIIRSGLFGKTDLSRAIGGAFAAVNLLDAQKRALLLEHRKILVKNLSFQNVLDFPDSYESWSRQYISAGALSMLAYGLVQGPEFDRCESKSLVNELIEEGAVLSLCGALGQFDEPENEGRGFTSSHFLSGIHGVLKAGTFEKNDNVTSDFIGAVAPYVPEISALCQSTNEQCQYWSKRIMSEFFPEKTSL